MATLAQTRLAPLVRAIRTRFRADDASTHAAALAYQLFLSTLALSLVGLAVIGLAEDVLPFELPAGTKEQFENLTGASATLGAVSFVALLWTASSLSRRASRALAVIFRTGSEGAVRGGLRALATTLGLIVLVGALPVVTGVISAVRVSNDLEIPFRVLGFVATTAMEFGLFLLAYDVLTPGTIGWRSHLPGAAVMTIGWGLFKLAGGLLLAYYVSRATLLYGTIGAVVGLLLFLRLASGMFVYGAELSAVLRDRAHPDADAGTHPAD
jgi:membrane protein